MGEWGRMERERVQETRFYLFCFLSCLLLFAYINRRKSGIVSMWTSTLAQYFCPYTCVLPLSVCFSFLFIVFGFYCHHDGEERFVKISKVQHALFWSGSHLCVAEPRLGTVETDLHVPLLILPVVLVSESPSLTQPDPEDVKWAFDGGTVRCWLG